MSHTFKVVAGGFVLLVLCLLVARLTGGASAAGAIATAVQVFIPLWLVAAGVNLWIGVAKAGYTLAEEAPIFLVVFAVPAAADLVVWWLVARGQPSS
ncbi:MAG TPA: hypothetical protein VIG08_13400 [Gemmatimonadales bacterium]